MKIIKKSINNSFLIIRLILKIFRDTKKVNKRKLRNLSKFHLKIRNGGKFLGILWIFLSKFNKVWLKNDQNLAKF